VRNLNDNLIRYLTNDFTGIFFFNDDNGATQDFIHSKGQISASVTHVVVELTNRLIEIFFFICSTLTLISALGIGAVAIAAPEGAGDAACGCGAATGALGLWSDVDLD